MLNNKGFVVSTVLYTILIAFLLFLGVTLNVFQSSARSVGNANDDLIDGRDVRVTLVELKGVCDAGGSWFKDSNGNYNEYLVKVDTPKGPVYWPRDFGGVTSTGDFDSNKFNGVYRNTTIECDLCSTKKINEIAGAQIGVKYNGSDSNITYVGTNENYLKLFDFCAP